MSLLPTAQLLTLQGQATPCSSLLLPTPRPASSLLLLPGPRAPLFHLPGSESDLIFETPE